tara:strand:- start:26 stop:895 length:870 start_codon:yes stop_codon:yes gene_type:complete
MFEEELVTNTIGRQFWIYKNDSFYQQRIAGAGPYQKQNLLQLRRLVPNPRTILDVGMNIAMNTIEYATWAKTVHGFEPTKQTYNMALKNIALAQAQTEADMTKGWHANGSRATGWSSCVINGEIHTHNCALSTEEGTTDIIIKKDNAGHNHIDNSDVPLPSGKERKHVVDQHKETITLKTLDSFAFEDVDIIKVDTEGHEFPVVLGAEKTIETHKPVVQLEMVDGQPERFGYSCQKIYDWFLERDFSILLSDGADAGTKWQHFPKKMERFFVHKSKYQGSTFSDLFELA